MLVTTILTTKSGPSYNDNRARIVVPDWYRYETLEGLELRQTA